MTMGMFVMGSIIRPLIVISICIPATRPPLRQSQYSVGGNRCNLIV
jgi:hypothetical protein